MKLFLDMDGVLADFDGALRARGVIDDEPEFHHRPPHEWTLAQGKLDRRIRRCMEDPEFWEDIKPLPDTYHLWDYAKVLHPRILTAIPNLTPIPDEIAVIKRRWIQQHFGPFPNEHVNVCRRAEKQNFATPSAILVDDMQANCKEWTEASGIAILHTDAITTIRKLQELYHD